MFPTALVIRQWVFAAAIISIRRHVLEAVRRSLHALLLTSTREAPRVLVALRNNSFPTNPSGNKK